MAKFYFDCFLYTGTVAELRADFPRLATGKIAKQVLREMMATGAKPQEIITKHGLEQVSDMAAVAQVVESVLADHPEQIESFLAGKETIVNWFFGQVMREMGGKANPHVVRSALQAALQKEGDTSDTQ